MKVQFVAKYGTNEIEIPISGKAAIKIKFVLKYGVNEINVPMPQGGYKKVRFWAKYGTNEIEIPDTEERNGLLDLFKSKVTIFNDIKETGAESRHFDKFVIDLCQIQGGYVNRADGTVQNIVNAKTVITKDIKRYIPPSDYALLPVDQREDYFTVRVGDYIVLKEVDDIVTTAQEFAALQNKYKNDGINVMSVSAFINGMGTDNVTITNV